MIELNEEQLIVRNSVARYLNDHCTFNQRQKQTELPGGYDPDQWTTFAELGWLGLPYPETYGGYGGSLVEAAIICDQLGRSLHRSPYLSCVIGAGIVLQNAGSEDQKQTYLQGISEGKRIVSCAFQETGSYTSGLPVKPIDANRNGDHYELNGTSTLVPYAGAASDYVVAARLSGELKLFVVPADASGVTVTEFKMYDGSRTGDLRFSRVKVEPGALLPGDASEATGFMEDCEAAMLCVEAAGIMWSVQEQTLDYMKTREQFGHKLAEFQALQHRIVDMYVSCQLAQSMAWDAVEAVSGDPDPRSRSRRVSAAKSYIGESGRSVGKEGVQLHGGIGMTNDLPIGHYLKRLTAIDHQHGNSDTHRKRFRRLDDESSTP